MLDMESTLFFSYLFAVIISLGAIGLIRYFFKKIRYKGAVTGTVIGIEKHDERVGTFITQYAVGDKFYIKKHMENPQNRLKKIGDLVDLQYHQGNPRKCKLYEDRSDFLWSLYMISVGVVFTFVICILPGLL